MIGWLVIGYPSHQWQKRMSFAKYGIQKENTPRLALHIPRRRQEANTLRNSIHPNALVPDRSNANDDILNTLGDRFFYPAESKTHTAAAPPILTENTGIGAPTIALEWTEHEALGLEQAPLFLAH